VLGLVPYWEALIRTQTILIDFAKLAAWGKPAPTVARIALVCNDLAVANSAMKHFDQMESKSLGHIRTGAKLYFVRIQCGHLVEGIAAIEKVKKIPELETLVWGCSPAAQAAFQQLCACLPDGQDYEKYEGHVAALRNKVAFHYDESQLKRAIDDRANPGTPSRQQGTITAGEDIHSTRFEFADYLLDSIVCRQLWKIPPAVEVRPEADRIADWCFKKCVAFLKFGEEFVPKFLRENQVLIR